MHSDRRRQGSSRPAGRTLPCRSSASKAIWKQWFARISSQSECRYSRGTTRLTRPKSRAVAASIVSPVSSISIACLRDTLRDSATIGVEQNRPILTPGVQKVALVARRSPGRSWRPAGSRRRWPAPSTSAMTGFGCVTIDCISAEQAAMVSSKNALPRSASLRCAVISLRSWPAENTLPVAAMTMTRTVAVAAGRLERRLQRGDHGARQRVGRRVGQRQPQDRPLGRARLPAAAARCA